MTTTATAAPAPIRTMNAGEFHAKHPFVCEGDKYMCTPETVQETIAKYGVAVIPNILNQDEINDMNTGVWDAFEHITNDWECPISRNDTTTWSQFSKLFPKHHMLHQYWKLGHAQYVWNLRQNPKIVQAFANIWRTDPEDMLTSFDGLSFYVPRELYAKNRKPNTGKPSGMKLHIDQAMDNRGFKCIQGFVSGYAAVPGSGTLAVLEKSHLFHDQYATEINPVRGTNPWVMVSDEHLNWYAEQGCRPVRLVYPPGSLVLWESRVIHCGVEPDETFMTPEMLQMAPKDRAQWRHVVYICMMPRTGVSAKILRKKHNALHDMRLTNHWANNPKLFAKVPHTYGAPIPVIRDLPFPKLTKLGWRISGAVPDPDHYKRDGDSDDMTDTTEEYVGKPVVKAEPVPEPRKRKPGLAQVRAEIKEYLEKLDQGRAAAAAAITEDTSAIIKDVDADADADADVIWVEAKPTEVEIIDLTSDDEE